MQKTANWTIDELSARVALALADGYEAARNGRVREVPDLRTIRYYTTLGLIDRPAEMRGRTALYSRKHLMQVVAIKRLQARGLSLAEVQQRLVGQSEKLLAQIAQLPTEPEASTRRTDRMPAMEARAAERGRKRRDTFWNELPSQPPSAEDQAGANARDGSSVQLQAVPLGDSAVLSLITSRPIDGEDIEAIRAAAAPLLKFLEKRRLLGPREPRRES